jgi:hypothetical protein
MEVLLVDPGDPESWSVDLLLIGSVFLKGALFSTGREA